MTATVTRGTSVTLTLEVSQFTGGPATDLTGLTITIRPAAGGSAVVGPTSTGISHPATGRYTYTWSVSASQTVGDYLAVWSGTDGDGDTVTGSETVSVVAAATVVTGAAAAAGVWYVTRETVKAALDVAETARANSQVDAVCEAASRSVESQLNRRFYPIAGTRYFDWPAGRPTSWPWRLWLYQDEVVSVDALVSGGVTIPAASYLLEPVNDGPPYNRIEINLGTSSAFTSGSTYQRSIAVIGTFGYTAAAVPAGALAEDLDTTETGVDVTDSSVVGVGDTLLVDSERMIVTGKSMLDTGVNIDASDSLTASAADVSITLSTLTSAPAVGETILIGSERMLVVDLAGGVATVKRAFDGTVLAAHAANADIYAPRTLTVTRGALGTSAATHNSATTVYRGWVPGPVVELALAEALTILLQRQSGYARTVSSGNMVKEVIGRGLADIRAQAYAAYGRKVRGRAV